MRVSLLIVLTLALTACDLPSRTTATLTPTRSLSAPPIQSSPSPEILSSDELYQNDEGVFIGQSNPTVAALPVDGDLPPVRVGDSGNVVDVVLSDGSVLFGDLYQTGDERRPGILMVGSDRASWGTLPLELQTAGFTVLVMETGLIPQAQHIETMLRTFINVGTVDPARIGVIGEAQGADIVMLACAVDELCDVIALLSPLSRDSLLNIIPSYGTRPILVASSNQDSEAYPTALMLSQTAQGDTRFIETNAGRGSGLLQFRPDLSSELVSWFLTYIGA